MSEPTPPEPAGSGGRPASLRLAIWLLFAQSVGVGVVVIVLLIESLPTPSGNTGGVIITIVYALLLAGVLGVLGAALARRRGWARGPAIVLQLLLLPVGSYMVAGGLAWLGVPVLVIGLVAAGALLAPATRAALGLR